MDKNNNERSGSLSKDIYSQYNVEDELEMPEFEESKGISVVKLPLTTEIKIGNQTVSVINPDYVDKLVKRISTLERHLTSVTTEIKRMKTAARIQESNISRMKNIPDSDYD